MTLPSRSGRWYATALPTSLLLLGAFFRLSGLARDQRFHPDEALYADLSRRVGIWGDWQLQSVPVDKPPLFFFTGGLFHRLLGDSEFSTRLPNAFASLITLALLFWLARRLGGNHAALFATLLVALSPFDIAFANSGFTDPQMLMWLMFSFVFLLRGEWWAGGIAFGLGMAVKPAVLWFLPLLVLITGNLPTLRELRRWAFGLLLILILINTWDAVSGLGSFWSLGQQNYAGGRLIRSDEVLPRLESWLDWLRYLLPHPIFALGFLGALGWKHRNRCQLILWGVAGFLLAYLGAHWLVAFNLFDQYLVPLTPLIALLAGMGLRRLMCSLSTDATLRGSKAGVGTRFIASVSPNLIKKNCHWAFIVFILLLRIPAAWNAANGNTPIANDEGQHEGIDTLADVMNLDFAGDVFYEHWLGWELRYYLGTDPQVYLLYFETPDDLIQHAQAELPTIPVPRYFVAPINETAPWIAAMESEGLRVELVYEDGRYAIYALTMRLADPGTDAASSGCPDGTC